MDSQDTWRQEFQPDASQQPGQNKASRTAICPKKKKQGRDKQRKRTPCMFKRKWDTGEAKLKRKTREPVLRRHRNKMQGRSYKNFSTNGENQGEMKGKL